MNSKSLVKRPTLWTIGYGGRNPSEFVQMLQQARVELIADVRYSTRASMGCYTKASSSDRGIEKLLLDVGIRYVWLPELGNPQRNDPEMTAFRERVIPQLFERSQRLITLAESSATCLLCACKLAARCHRSFISSWFQGQGWTIVNLE